MTTKKFLKTTNQKGENKKIESARSKKKNLNSEVSLVHRFFRGIVSDVGEGSLAYSYNRAPKAHPPGRSRKVAARARKRVKRGKVHI